MQWAWHGSCRTGLDLTSVEAEGSTLSTHNSKFNPIPQNAQASSSSTDFSMGWWCLGGMSLAKSNDFTAAEVIHNAKCNLGKSAHTGYGVCPWTDAAGQLINNGNIVSVLHINAFLLYGTFLCYTSIFVLKIITGNVHMGLVRPGRIKKLSIFQPIIWKAKYHPCQN